MEIPVKRHIFWNNRYSRGFTLAELLIALGILGTIATFTIPKVLSSQADGRNNAAAKEAASMVSGAYQRMQQLGVVSASTKSSDLTPYLNYVQLYTASVQFDPHPQPGPTPVTCSNTVPCIRLHNGALMAFWSEQFGGTATTNVIQLVFDPQGSASGVADSVQFELYYNGFITTRGEAKPGSSYSGCPGCVNPNPIYDPTWFSW